MSGGARRPLPGSFIAASFAAAACIAAGAIGLARVPQLPMLHPPAVAWSFIAVGVMMDLWAIVALIAWVREGRQGK